MFLLAVIFLSLVWSTISSSQIIETCDHKIFCKGNLLKTIQLARIFGDSKTFVDMHLLNSVDVTLKKFEEFITEKNNNPSREELKLFVTENFEITNDLEEWSPPDYNPNPKFLDEIFDEDMRNFAKVQIHIWPLLARIVNKEVWANPEQYSLIPVPNGFIIPGGRFSEIYYWDTYWIIKGLLLSGMVDTAKGMIENLVSLVDRFGFVPNGSRVYYLDRSQPPLLTLMVVLYIQNTVDLEWLRRNVKFLDKELQFWLEKRTISVKKGMREYTLAHYAAESNTPRPESFFEDIETCDVLYDDEYKRQCYIELKSGAESGWDFSSRWIFDENGGNSANLSYIQTSRVIPVDLNAFLCRAFQDLSNLYTVIGDNNMAKLWGQKALYWKISIQNILYDYNDGIWYDYDLTLSQPRKIFYPSNFAPLWAEAYLPLLKRIYGRRAANYFMNNSINNYQGGIPTSLLFSGEQWDYPNAWPPLQEIVILGLYESGDSKAQKIAKEFAQRWLRANMIGYNKTGEMFEKYDASKLGGYGEGGEYTVQNGFGWTNGVVLSLIDAFYKNKLNT